MSDWRNWLIGGLCVGLIGFVWLSVVCSRNEAMADIYRECNSYQMWEDGSYYCERRDTGVNYYNCLEGAICND